MENIEVTKKGIVCDNTKCDFKTKDINPKDYKAWLNKPCPKCGDNLLTQEDYNTFIHIMRMIDKVNKVDLGSENSDNKRVIIEVGTHKDIYIKKIKNVQD